MDVRIVLVLFTVVAVLSLFIGYLGHKLAIARTLGDAETRAKSILDEGRRSVEQARSDAETKLREGEARIRSAELEAKEMALKMRSELEQETRARQKEIQGVERPAPSSRRRGAPAGSTNSTAGSRSCRGATAP